MVRLLAIFFASRRRHTSSKRDWSSDVCSSDLGYAIRRGGRRSRGRRAPGRSHSRATGPPPRRRGSRWAAGRGPRPPAKIGRASCRERREGAWVELASAEYDMKNEAVESYV